MLGMGQRGRAKKQIEAWRAYRRRVRRLAWSMTYGQTAGRPMLSTGACFILGGVFFGFWKGWDKALDELHVFIAFNFVAAVAVGLAVYLFNLLVVAPFQISRQDALKYAKTEHERRIEMRGKLAAQAKLAKKGIASGVIEKLDDLYGRMSRLVAKIKTTNLKMTDGMFAELDREAQALHEEAERLIQTHLPGDLNSYESDTGMEFSATLTGSSRGNRLWIWLGRRASRIGEIKNRIRGEAR